MSFLGIGLKKERVAEKKAEPAVKKLEVKVLKERVVNREKKVGSKDSSEVIIAPRITEKATTLSANRIYVFNVFKDVKSQDVKDAIFEIYKISPIRVSVVNVKGKRVFVRGKRGRTSSGRKAYVYLKKGDKLDIV